MASLDADVFHHLCVLQAYFPKEEVLWAIAYWYEDQQNDLAVELLKYCLPSGSDVLGSKLEARQGQAKQQRTRFWGGDILEEADLPRYAQFVFPATKDGMGHS